MADKATELDEGDLKLNSRREPKDKEDAVSQYSESDHVSNLGDALGDEDFRNSFTSDPSQALQDRGIDEQALPDGVMDALRGCQPPELAALANVKDALRKAGVDRKYWAEIV